ncbi:LysR family transcriptional regulator, partial [Hydrogenophaga sp.]|uniref:LysR family transcriptional regulator n=1 Tax=Hydrogenophaga sp. TaxID=1904254 RepID=UPI003FA536C6
MSSRKPWPWMPPPLEKSTSKSKHTLRSSTTCTAVTPVISNPVDGKTIDGRQHQENLIKLIASIRWSRAMSTLDLDLVRTFVAVAERGSFNAAAARVWRSQAAV